MANESVAIRTHKDETVEIRFGIKELTAIDRELGLKVEEIELGEGMELLASKLQTGNLIGVSKIVKACLPKKHQPKNDEELETILENIIEDYEGFDKFGQECIEVLGNRPLTRAIVEKLA